MRKYKTRRIDICSICRMPKRGDGLRNDVNMLPKNKKYDYRCCDEEVCENVDETDTESEYYYVPDMPINCRGGGHNLTEWRIEHVTNASLAVQWTKSTWIKQKAKFIIKGQTCEKCKKNPGIVGHEVWQTGYCRDCGEKIRQVKKIVALCRKCHNNEHGNIRKNSIALTKRKHTVISPFEPVSSSEP